MHTGLLPTEVVGLVLGLRRKTTVLAGATLVAASIVASCDAQVAEAPSPTPSLTAAVAAPKTTVPPATPATTPDSEAAARLSATTTPDPSPTPATQPTATPEPRPTDTPVATPMPELVRRSDGMVAHMVRAADGAVVRLGTETDPLVSLTIPPGALSADTDISIRRLAPEEWPAGVRPDAPVLAAYEFEPDGLEFEKPIELEVHLGPDVVATIDVSGGLPLIGLLIHRTDDTWTVPSGLAARYDLDDGSIVVRGQVTHFSRALATAAKAEITAQLWPSRFSEPVPVNEPFRPVVIVANTGSTNAHVTLEYLAEGDVSIVRPGDRGFQMGPGTVVRVDPSPAFQCDTPGRGRYRVGFEFEIDVPLAAQAFGFLAGHILTEEFEKEVERFQVGTFVSYPLSIRGEVACESPGGTGVEFVQAFPYRETFIPLDEVAIAPPDACGAPHWHAASANRVATAIDGTLHPDPALPLCGFGPIGEVAFQMVRVPG